MKTRPWLVLNLSFLTLFPSPVTTLCFTEVSLKLISEPKDSNPLKVEALALRDDEGA